MQRKNCDANAKMRELLLRMDGKLAETSSALLCMKNYVLSPGILQAIEEGLRLLVVLKGTNLKDLCNTPGVEVLESMQQKMEGAEFQKTIFVIQKCLEDDSELSNEEFSVAERFIGELQATWGENRFREYFAAKTGNK